MSKNHTINMAALVAPIISSRDVISVVREAVERQAQPVVELDFATVQFISRSAAHELLQMKEQLANKEPVIQVDFQNTSGDVAKMLRVVASNRAVPKKPTASADIKAVSIDELTHDKPTPLGFFRRLFAQ
jgi:hypothetical protein